MPKIRNISENRIRLRFNAMKVRIEPGEEKTLDLRGMKIKAQDRIVKWLKREYKDRIELIEEKIEKEKEGSK